MHNKLEEENNIMKEILGPKSREGHRLQPKKPVKNITNMAVDITKVKSKVVWTFCILPPPCSSHKTLIHIGKVKSTTPWIL